MILDTACQGTCCGVNWASAHTSSLRDRDLQVYRAVCSDAFQFGSGDPVKARHRLYMPAGIGQADLIIGAKVLEANIPLLASNVLLENLGMVLDMPRSSATFATLGVTVPVFRVNGHLAISVVQFSTTDASDSTSWKALQESVDWKPSRACAFGPRRGRHSSCPSFGASCCSLHRHGCAIGAAWCTRFEPSSGRCSSTWRGR